MTNKQLYEKIMRSVSIEVKKAINEGWKHWALAGMIGASTMVGTTGCQPVNAPIENYYQHNHADEWIYGDIAGEEYDAAVVDMYNHDYINELQIDHVQYRKVHKNGTAVIIKDAEYVDSISGRVDVTKYDAYVCDYYYCENAAECNNGDIPVSDCYIAVYYDKDERRPMDERIQFLTVFHSFEDREDTEFKLNIDKARNAGTGNGYYFHISD